MDAHSIQTRHIRTQSPGGEIENSRAPNPTTSPTRLSTGVIVAIVVGSIDAVAVVGII